MLSTFQCAENMRALEGAQHQHRDRRTHRSGHEEGRHKGEQSCLGIAHHECGNRVGSQTAENAGAEYLTNVSDRQLRAGLVGQTAQQRTDHRAGERQQTSQAEHIAN